MVWGSKTNPKSEQKREFKNIYDKEDFSYK